MHNSGTGEASVRAIFRTVNEQINALSETFELQGANCYVCECAELNCTRTVEMTRAEYEAICAQPGRWLVALEHQGSRSEIAVAENRR